MAKRKAFVCKTKCYFLDRRRRPGQIYYFTDAEQKNKGFSTDYFRPVPKVMTEQEKPMDWDKVTPSKKMAKETLIQYANDHLGLDVTDKMTVDTILEEIKKEEENLK